MARTQTDADKAYRVKLTEPDAKYPVYRGPYAQPQTAKAEATRLRNNLSHRPGIVVEVETLTGEWETL